MLAYCGINCNECPAYKGTVATDIGLLEKVAGSSWAGAQSAPEWVCLGCTPADQGFLAKDCATCKIRDCAIAKDVQNCAACSDFESCKLMQDFIKGESEPRCNEPEKLRQRMEWLRGRFLAYKKERAARPGAKR
jgi:hypothetical protein